MKRTIYVPTEYEKAEVCRLLLALIEADVSNSLDAQKIRVNSRGFSLMGLSINDVRTLINKFKNVNRNRNKKSICSDNSHRLPISYTRANVVKQLTEES